MGLPSLQSGLQLRSLIKKSGELEVSLAKVEITPPAANEVVIRIEASPINPSDLGMLFGAADMATARQTGTSKNPVITAEVPESAMPAMAARLDQPLPVGKFPSGDDRLAG